jgi:GrpB-like predicted nucleotidyltransferase (UPF0157 family)
MAGKPSTPVIIVPYDPAWPAAARALAQVYAAALSDLTTAVEHVGSTSVPGLAAKPIIDINIVIASRALLPEVIERLASLGYQHQGDLGIVEREAFKGDGSDEVPRDGSGRHWPAHHLYVCAADNEELRRQILFRDWLRTHPEDADAYGALKEQLAQRFRHDREGYTNAKTAFIEEVLRAAEART